jgi:hypothetical protein
VQLRPSYRAWVYDRRANARIRKTFSGKGALAAAKGWLAAAEASGVLMPV